MKRSPLLVIVGLTLALTLVVPLTSCGTAGGSATEVKVTLGDFSIQSSVTTFTKGTAYHFVVTNTGQVLHELMAVPTSTAHGTEEEIDRARLFEVEDIDAGQTKTLDYTFNDAAPAGTLEFACHQPGHYEKGMRLDISVS